MKIYFLFVFIPALITRILSNPSGVLWALLFINSATWQKSRKSLFLFPIIGCFWKRGISLSVISDNFTTLNSEMPVRSFIKPPPKSLLKHFNNSRSRLCWVIKNLRITWCPILWEEDFSISTEKLPSPLVKPANQ